MKLIISDWILLNLRIDYPCCEIRKDVGSWDSPDGSFEVYDGDKLIHISYYYKSNDCKMVTLDSYRHYLECVGI